MSRIAQFPGPPAGVVTRVLAAVVDAGAVWVAAALLYLGVVALRFAWWPASFTWPRPHTVVSALSVFLIATAYLTIGWATAGRTSGAGLLGLRVLSSRRELLGWPRAASRAALCVAFPIGLLWAGISPSRRSLQDVLLRSMVIYDWRRDGGGAHWRDD